MEEEKQKKIVAFELMQKMPVQPELIWDYQVIDDDGVEQEILAFAVKPKVAEDFCERVMEIGLNPVLHQLLFWITTCEEGIAARLWWLTWAINQSSFFH